MLPMNWSFSVGNNFKLKTKISGIPQHRLDSDYQTVESVKDRLIDCVIL